MEQATNWPRPGYFFAVFALVIMVAVGIVTAPVYAGRDPGYLTVLTPFFQFVPFLTILVLHGVYRARANPADRSRLRLWSETGVKWRGKGWPIIRTSLLALVVLTVVGAVPVLVAGAAGFIELRLADGAGLAVLLTLPVSLLFMIPVAGEELAWRGYLTTLLSPRGFVATTVLIGSLWALWHLPLTIAYAYSGELATRDVISKTVDLLLAAVLVSAMRYLSSSVWPAVFAHALFNNLLQMIQSSFMTPLSGATAGGYWGYMAVSWTAWIVIDAVLVAMVLRTTSGRLSE